ncbi:MAG: hypothetical protein ACOC22_04405 [bacterium]
MKLKNLSNWEYTDDLDCMLYFAQSLDEMLFNYTLDSYKAPALNSHTLCIEALIIITEIKQGIISKGAIDPILAELDCNLRKDIVSKNILDEQLDFYINKFKEGLDLDNLYSTIELINKSFEERKFLNEAIKILKQKIKSNKEKEKIAILSRIFVTELINLGYDRNFIYNQVNSHFFGRDKINSISQLSDFFNIFNFKTYKYRLTFFVSKLFKEIKEASKTLGLEAYDDINLNNFSSNIKNYIENLKEDKYFVSISIEAMDYYSAYHLAENNIEKIACLFNFFHHKNKLSWKPKILIENLDQSENLLLNKPDPSILNCKDLRPNKASQDLKKTIKNFELATDSFNRIDKSLDLHSYALNTDTLENQLINIWTSFETLLPKKENIKKDRITQLKDTMLPFQCIDYIKKLIQYIQKSLIDWNFKKYAYICKSVEEGDDTLVKIGAFISLAKYDDLRNEIYTYLSDENYSILINRIFTLNKNLSSVDSVKELIISHKNRISWHFQRIYRTRNLIIHSGQLFSFTSVLIENLHSYYDIIIKQIFKLKINENKIDTLEQAFIESSIRYNNHMEYLESNKNKNTGEIDFKKVLFGVN